MKISTYIPLNTDIAAGVPGRGSGIYMWADSCWLLSDRPLYIPDFAESCVAIPALAVKSARLGKSIPPRFSLRYIGDWTASIIILPAGIESDFRSGLPIDIASLCFDNAIVIGDWQKSRPIPAPLPPAEEAPAGASQMLPDKLEIVFTPASGDTDTVTEVIEKRQPVTLSPGQWPEAITRISQNNVVKTGDITLFPADVSYRLSPGDSIRIFIPGDGAAHDTPILITKFK